MDFGKRIPKDKQPGADGLWGWESPRLRKALEEEKKAKWAKSAHGLTPTNYRTIKDVEMIANDMAGLTGAKVAKDAHGWPLVEPRAESVCKHRALWYNDFTHQYKCADCYKGSFDARAPVEEWQ